MKWKTKISTCKRTNAIAVTPTAAKGSSRQNRLCVKVRLRETTLSLQSPFSAHSRRPCKPQRRSGVRPYRRNVPGAAIAPIPSVITVTNGPLQTLALPAAKVCFEPKMTDVAPRTNRQAAASENGMPSEIKLLSYAPNGSTNDPLKPGGLSLIH